MSFSAMLALAAFAIGLAGRGPCIMSGPTDSPVHPHHHGVLHTHHHPHHHGCDDRIHRHGVPSEMCCADDHGHHHDPCSTSEFSVVVRRASLLDAIEFQTMLPVKHLDQAGHRVLMSAWWRYPLKVPPGDCFRAGQTQLRTVILRT